MRLNNSRAVARRVWVGVVAIALCLVPVIQGARAQEMPAGGPSAIASSGEPVLLREQPGYDAAVLATLDDGNPLDIAGEPVTAADGTTWLPVVVGGQSGFVPTGYVLINSTTGEPAPAAEAALEPVLETAANPGSSNPVAAPGPTGATQSQGSTGATRTEANLRSGPGVDSAVLTVLPLGAALSIDGPVENGFVPVTGNGVSGWIAADLLGDSTAVAAPVANAPSGDVPTPVPTAEPPTTTVERAAKGARGESTGIAWPMAGGEWKVVQGYNTGTHTNRSDFAQYKYSLDWAKVDGDTAGQPVFAPVSGTVQWVDRGSGGMLIDAGNGYGVAVFHVTLDHDLASGGTVAQGQRIGTISGPGGDGYMSMAHIDITVWQLSGRGHESVPFIGPNAIAGQAFPDSGGANQHMGATVTP
jgi:murein DD-endopeptidase MepM/ murein hydrolase activator NlpD